MIKQNCSVRYFIIIYPCLTLLLTLLQSLFVVDALIRHGIYLGEKRRKTNILEQL